MNDPTPADTTASTNGWDTVYALYFPDVNTAIRVAKSSPPPFTFTDSGTTLAGSFGDWQLSAGGDGENLHMSIPITSSTLTMTGAPIACTLITVTIEVKLGWLSSDNTSTQQLKVATTSDTPQDAPVNILPSSTNYGTNKLSIMQQGVYIALLGEWFNQSLKAFQHVFSTITLNTILDKNQGFQWMMPTSTLYAVVDKADSTGAEDFDKSIFGVLCMTGNRTSPGVHTVSPYAIPDGANSAFLISPERVLGDMFLPGLPYMFKGRPATSSFTVTPTTITNNVDLQFTDQLLDNGNTVAPTIPAGNFTIELIGNLVEISMHGLHFEYTSGFTVTIDHVSNATLQLNTSRQFKLDVTGTPTTSANVSESKGMQLGIIIGTIAASIIGAAAGGFLSGVASGGAVAIAEGGESAAIGAIEVSVAESGPNESINLIGEATADAAAQVFSDAVGNFKNFFAANWAKLLGAAIAGAAVSSTPAVIEFLANNEASKIPTLDDFGSQMMAPIVWPNMQTQGDLVLGGTLNGSLQIGLNLTPVAVPPVAGAPA